MYGRLLRAFSLLALCLCGPAFEARAQETSTDYAWHEFLKHEGLEITYIYYVQRGATADGLVLKLVNRNDYPIDYHFDVVFRTEGAEHVEAVSGSMRAREIKTGDSAGLYWIPFKDGRPIIELGVRGYEVTRRETDPPPVAKPTS